MFDWLKRRKGGTGASPAESALGRAVRSACLDGDEETARIVGAVAALMLCVAHADQRFAPEEQELIRATLGRIQGLDPAGVGTILGVLREHRVSIAAREASSYARDLLELCAVDFRRELLDVLVDLAAADEVIELSEANMLRGIARALGLTQDDYNASQARHRAKLGVLKRG
jgi:uncharacterized tellurite resistance protein B-like protein